MDPISRLEARIHSLENSRDRSRLVALALALVLALLVGAAWVPQEPSELTTPRLVLKGSGATPYDTDVVLVAGREGALVVQAPNGREVARIGGPAARQVR